MANAKKKILEFISKEEYETLLAFHDIAQEVLDNRLEKIIIFGRTSKQESNGNLDILFLLSELESSDAGEIAQIAEDLSENSVTKITPLVLDSAQYKAGQTKSHPLLHDIQATGIEFKAP